MSRRASLHPALLLIVPTSLLGWLLWASAPVHRAEASRSVGTAKAESHAQGIDEPASDTEDTTFAPLRFDEVFVVPAGPKGLEYTEKVRSLDGRKVAMTGYMVKNYGPDPSVFVFSDVPRIHNEREEGLADSLPPGLLHVIMDIRPGDAPAWRREKMTLYGTLELGARQEANGRISYLRLHCDHITDFQTGRRIEVRKPVVLQRNRMAPAAAGDPAALINGGSPIFFHPRRSTNPTSTSPSK